MTDESVFDDEPERGEYDSGPFCRHWSDPSDCEEICASCGHSCGDHGEFGCDECDCDGWEEPLAPSADVR